MPLPRAPKITRSKLPKREGPSHEEVWRDPDPFGLHPKEPWLRITHQRVPAPDLLERLEGGEWVAMGEGVFRIHGHLAPDRAIVSIDQQRLLELRPDGSEIVLWEGPRLRLVHGGIWGDNWMFAAVALPDGRWVAALPETSDASRGPETWVQELVLFSADHRRIASLPLPERTDSAVKKGSRRRFVARRLLPAAGGRVVLAPDEELLAVGVYDDRLAWIGKTTMPGEGGIWVDGEQALVSSSLANTNVNFTRLEGLDALWEKKRP